MKALALCLALGLLVVLKTASLARRARCGCGRLLPDDPLEECPCAPPSIPARRAASEAAESEDGPMSLRPRVLESMGVGGR